MKATRLAHVFFNHDLYTFVPMAHGVFSYPVPETPARYVLPSANDEELGTALRMTLAASKLASTAQFRALHESGLISRTGQERDAVIGTSPYQNRQDLYRLVRCCHVTARDTRIEVAPTNRIGTGRFAKSNLPGLDTIVIHDRGVDEELGAALRRGFSQSLHQLR